nr:farnesoic acid O-methyltransferase [Sogatella furcifera]
MALELTTEDKLEYQFHEVSGGSLHFKVKAANDAHIALTTGPEESEPIYEIFIGGWSNAKSAIRKNKQKPDAALVETPNILNGDEQLAFWVRWNGGAIAVGRQGEADPFISWEDPEPFVVTHYGICTGWGATGEWVIDAPIAQPGWAVDPAAEGAAPGGPATWVPVAEGEPVPPSAIPAGLDHGGEQLYVGRAKHDSGALIPGKVVPSHGVCYVPWGGGEHGIAEYEVLTSCEVTWMPSASGQVPSGALVAGETEDGETLYIGRATHEGVSSVGKVQGTHGVCYIPYGGSEIAYNDYEVLVAK